MVTQAQADRYDVEAISLEQGLAMSAGGDVGRLTLFFDDEGLKCDATHAECAVVEWPDPSVYTVIHLCDYEPRVLH